MKLGEKQKKELVELTQELIRRPSVSGEEDKVAKFIKKQWKNLVTMKLGLMSTAV